MTFGNVYVLFSPTFIFKGGKNSAVALVLLPASKTGGPRFTHRAGVNLMINLSVTVAFR